MFDILNVDSSICINEIVSMFNREMLKVNLLELGKLYKEWRQITYKYLKKKLNLWKAFENIKAYKQFVNIVKGQ